MSETEPEVVLDSTALDELNNPEAKALLDTVDSLRAVDVGEIVHLPQIIVVGDQSSGKSSVLEAISHVRFPVRGDVCTRFATELVLRKASASKVDVSIRFSSSAGSTNRSSEPFRKAGFGRDDLPQLIAEATERMGVRAGTKKDFSKDVLRVEITGPEVPSLTLVDLPGFFHSATADQSLQGKNTVDELVRGYMEQENSIILVVVAASAQIAGQIVLDKCLEHDTGRARTLGMSRRTFAETVVNLAVESCLVCRVDEILTPSQVNLMEDGDVRELASESPEVACERELLQTQVAKLEDGLKICQYHQPWGAQALPSTLSASRANSKRPPQPPQPASNTTSSNGSKNGSKSGSLFSNPRTSAANPKVSDNLFIFNTSPSGQDTDSSPPAKRRSNGSLFGQPPIFTFPSGSLTTNTPHRTPK